MHRPLDLNELRLVGALLAGVEVAWTAPSLGELMVIDMDDGGMGSLRFASPPSGRYFGRQLVEGWYLDADKVPISVAINVD